MSKNAALRNEFKDAYPIVKWDMKHRIIDCNLTSLPLMAEWNCKKGLVLSNLLLQSHEEIKKSVEQLQDSQCKITFGDLQIWFDIVPFPEAGYIGLYGYHIESMVSETMPQNLRMAS